MAASQTTLLVLVTWAIAPVFAQGQDWPMRGGSPDRNPVVSDSIVGDWSFDWQTGVYTKSGKQKNVHWVARLGSISCGDPVIANGLVWVGTNNGHPRDSARTEDASVLMCFREADGKFLWQYLSPRHEAGRTVDWPITSFSSSPHIEADRMWFCTNRNEVICLDIGPLLDGSGVPRELWKIDMRQKFGVCPPHVQIGSRHSHSSPAVYDDYLFVNTTQSPQYGFQPDPETPSLICLNKETGKVLWTDHSPGDQLLGPQLGSPMIIDEGMSSQVVMGQADGWLRSFDCLTGELLWKFDINQKDARVSCDEKSIIKYSGQVIADPVFADGRLFVVSGYEYEIGQPAGRLCCIDTTRSGDVSSHLLNGAEIVDNPGSALIWEFRGSTAGEAGFAADQKDPETMHSSLSSVAVADGMVIATDLVGCVHCLDAKNGDRHWSFDTMAKIIGSPLVVGDRIHVGNEDGDMYIIPLSEKFDRDLVQVRSFRSWFEASPVFANGKLFAMTRDELWVIGEKNE